VKLWEKEYKLNKQIEEFTIGDDYILDAKLISYDCIASIAHTQMLGKISILKKSEVKKIVSVLNDIIKMDAIGKFKISKEQEDSHTAIEEYLVKKLGSVGKKIHTARSRNDQVLVALRLYYKDELLACKILAEEFIHVLQNFIEKYEDVKLPGYTHMRKAMPSNISMFSNSFIDSMKDNLKLVDSAIGLVDQSPLGAAAGYGTPIEIDKEFVANMLQFSKVQENPIYTQNSRGKFEATILHSLSQIMFDLNKLASDIILFSMPEFGYFNLPKDICTGSSIMPHKKNPDVLELVRAKYHIVVSYEFQIKELTSHLISGYHRDLQLTKKPVMEGIDITKSSISIMNLVISNMKVDKQKCKKALSKEIFATEEVHKLVKKGMPFREAYGIIAKKF
jgi:argininosuccinate lyase